MDSLPIAQSATEGSPTLQVIILRWLGLWQHCAGRGVAGATHPKLPRPSAARHGPQRVLPQATESLCNF
jgi:hypothetical protein